MCHHGAGYGAGPGIEQGLINVAAQVDSAIQKISSPRVGIGEEQEDEHIIGVILTSRFSPRRSIELFGKRAEKPQLKICRQSMTWVRMNHMMHQNSQIKRSLVPWNLSYSLQKERMGPLKVEHTLRVTNNVFTTDMTNPHEAPLRLLSGGSYSWRQWRTQRLGCGLSNLHFSTQKPTKRL